WASSWGWIACAGRWPGWAIRRAPSPPGRTRGRKAKGSTPPRPTRRLAPAANGRVPPAAMTEAVLRAAGLRTGLYSSPHLSRFTERIRIAGREVEGDRLAALDRLVVATEVPLTYFEVATALAFLAMAEAGVEVAVLATGLGRRLDAATSCVHCATAITSIGLDHTGYLGTTLPEIAGEKAGIMKLGVPCFVGPVPAAPGHALH